MNPLMALAGFASAILGCAASGPFVPDTRDKVEAPATRTGGDADDVFLRAPWEIWRMPNGVGRHHREAHLLLPDKLESFQVRDIAVYQPDGSDVRVEYYSVDLGGGAQAHESIAVSVYRSTTSLDGAWESATDRMMRRWPNATPTQAFPLPQHHAADAKQQAWVSQARVGESTQATFVQLILFQEGKWTVQYQVSCPASDVDAAREKTRAFLASLRDSAWSDRTD